MSSVATPSTAGEFHPMIKTVQKIVLYETKSRLYVVGSNNAETEFRVLKVDRTCPHNLVVNDDRISYSPHQFRELLTMIDVGNRSKVGQKVGSGLRRTASAFGLVGFVRFLEGYYILLITKRRKAATIGQHSIYKIEDTLLLPLPNDDIRDKHPDEEKYVKMFNNFDLSSNFYFSYSYDLTYTLQHHLENPHFLRTCNGLEVIDSTSYTTKVFFHALPNERYLWNRYLMEPLCGSNAVSADWLLPVIHGFVDQGNVSIYGSPVLITLIARRSNLYAGTRFLKRGSNLDGDCANEVETEQIVADCDTSSFNVGRFSSFVQIRASVPGRWSQPLTAKPPIYFELPDPYGKISGRHFNHLMKKYGTPVLVLNLMKKRDNFERDYRREGLLSDEFRRQIEYLNQFLPSAHAIQYIPFDMARCKKRKGNEVMKKLMDIASYAVKQTGICYSDAGGNRAFSTRTGITKQTGVVRTNCVDCLDRTNTAQYVVAKCALTLQLKALGYLWEPMLEFDCDCCRMLETMFEDHGDTLALQYGGSQLIHRIKSYRKQSKWTSKAADITQTARRFYSNALTDAEKQNTINLFLGVFRPNRDDVQMWDKDFTSDHYLHLKQLNGTRHLDNLLHHMCTQWWDEDLENTLPYPLEENRKVCISLITSESISEDSNDLYKDFYHPLEFSVMNELFLFKEVCHSVRDYMPHCSINFSPFLVRDREVKRREDNHRDKSSLPSILFFSLGDKLWKTPYPNISTSTSIKSSSDVPLNTELTRASPKTTLVKVSKSPSVASNIRVNSSDEEDETSADAVSSDELEILGDFNEITNNANIVRFSNKKPLTFDTSFASMKDSYGVELKSSSSLDIILYQRYVNIGRQASTSVPDETHLSSTFTAKSMSCHLSMWDETLSLCLGLPFSPPAPMDERENGDGQDEFISPIRSEDTLIYKGHIRCGKTAKPEICQEDRHIYSEWIQQYPASIQGTG